MSIQAEALRKFIGKPAKDIYSRYIGIVVGITLDNTGKLRSVGVDRGDIFEEFSVAQTMIDGENFMLIPSWKISAENFRKDSSLTRKRFQALSELKKTSEIPGHVYEELNSEYNDSMAKLEESQKKLTETLMKKIGDLDQHIKHMERFLGCLKVQHRTGELSDDAFKIASEHITFEIENALHETKDIQTSLDMLAAPFSEIQMTSEQQFEKPKAPMSPETHTEDPIVVRLSMSK